MHERPERIGRFRILDLLGRGAMGVVYKAHDPDIDRIVAIKLIRADLLDGESRAHYLGRFQNEARMAGRCVHPNIVGIHDLSSHEDNPFLVLEYVDGIDLGRATPRGTMLDVAMTGRVMRQVLSALDYAHGFGVIHRDIKPANILLAGNGVKVTDFGISRALSAEATMSSVLVGTPCYMSPEQCLGNAVDERSDLFSVGCVLYEMLAGRRAFAADNYVATMHRLIHDEPEPLAALRPELPPALVAVVGQALAKRPQDRFANAAAMGAALDAALGTATADPGAASVAGPIGGSVAPAPVDDDSTVIAFGTGGAAAAVPPAGTWGAELSATLSQTASNTLQAVERRLAHHVGPMARRYLQRAMTNATSFDDLCGRLADTLPSPTNRDEFLSEVRTLLSRDPALKDALTQSQGGPAAPPPLDEAAIARVRQALAQILGPIAPRLLSRMLKDSPDLDQLRARCLDQISRPDEKERFLKLAGA